MNNMVNSIRYGRFLTVILCLIFLIFPAFVTFSSGKQEIKEENRLVMVINYPYQIWSADPTNIHVTLFKPDFTPARGAEVKVNNKVFGRSDKDGVCIFDYVPGNVESHKCEATLVEGGVRYREIKVFSCGSRTVSFKAERLYVYTDRGVYNPGQTVFVRIIAWSLKGEYAAIPDAEIQLLFQDKTGKVYSGEYVKTDEYGIASTAFSLPRHMPEGDYELVVLYEKARESARLRVKRFIPPIINIKHNLKRYLTDTQTSLEANVELSYFSGGTMTSSTFLFIVENHRGEEVFKRKLSAKKPIYSFTLGRTDLDEIRGGLLIEKDCKIKLRVTDSYGQTDEVAWDVTYTARPYSAVIELDKDAYPEGETVQLLARVVDIDRQPASRIGLILQIEAMNLELTSETDEKGVARFEFIMPAFVVTATLRSPIMKPLLGERAIPFQVVKPMSSKVTELPKKAGMKTNITVYFDPDYVPVEKVIHVDLTDISGALVQATTIPVYKNGENYYAEGEVSAPTWGSMLVNVYCCAVEKGNSDKPFTHETVGFITEGQHVTFYPDRELDIVIENFKPQAAPGEQTTFRITVKGGKGEKILGVSVVDDAVISLLDPFIISPVSHFYNPQAKVIATGGAGVLTWPVVDRNWGSPCRDIAYSNWGWKAPGAFVSGTYGEGEKGEEAPPLPSAKDAEGVTGEGMESKKKSYEYEKSISTDEKEELAVESLDDGQYKTTNGDEENGRGNRDGKGEEASGKTIIIRTRFPETALWEPLLKTKGGKVTVTVNLPDEITTQKLSVLATDREGYIGLLRKDITVTQPVFIRAAFPPSMVRGDRITVHAMVKNLTASPLTCKVRLQSDSLTVIGSKVVSITLPANETKRAEWTIAGSTCGEKEYTLSVRTDSFSDAEKKKIYVLPDGIPDIRVVKDTIRARNKFEHRFNISRDATYRVATINVSLPNVFPAFQGWYAFDISPWYSPWAVAATAIMNSAMLEYVRSQKGTGEKEKLLIDKLGQASFVLNKNQLSSGAWGWYPVLGEGRGEEPVNGINLYYTVTCLRSLLEIRRMGLTVDERVLQRAVEYILKNRDKGGLWSSKGAYFWEVFNDETDYALSAEIFEVLTLALTLVKDPYEFEMDVRSVKEMMLEVLEKKSYEPMTVAAAIQGLLYWKKFAQDSSLKQIVQQGLQHLISLKRTGYWEPHWYHAYGGMVELNARILSLLAEYNPKEYAGYFREGITWLLSTREAWGAWHNEIGTANAIRALLKAGVFTEEEQSTIVLIVNGREVAKVHIDPRDPFLSAAKLAYYDISPWIGGGENSVTVTYSGKLDASVILEVREWGKEGKGYEKSVEINRKVPKEAAIGQPVRVNLSLKTTKLIPSILIEEAIPSNCLVEENSLDELLQKQVITDYRVSEGKLYLFLVQVKGNVDLIYRLTPVLKGKGIHGGTTVSDAASGTLLAVLVNDTLIVK